MANADRPSGLSPVQYLNGAPWTGGGRVYSILAANTDIFAIGDPVKSGGSADANGIASVALATAGVGNPIRGVIVGMGGTKYGAHYGDPTNLNQTVIPSVKTKNYYVLVVDDPMVIFEVQEVSGGTALTAAEVGLNADLIAGTNNGFISGWELNNAGEGVGATIQCRLLQLAPRNDNAFGEHAKWWVLINNHELKAGTVGL